MIYNQNRLNLEVLKQIYQLNSPARNDDTGGGQRNQNNNNEGRMIRAFERRFADIAGELGGNKIQALLQLGSLESMEKEIDQLARKYENLVEMLDYTAE